MKNFSSYILVSLFLVHFSSPLKASNLSSEEVIVEMQNYEPRRDLAQDSEEVETADFPDEDLDADFTEEPDYNTEDLADNTIQPFTVDELPKIEVKINELTAVRSSTSRRVYLLKGSNPEVGKILLLRKDDRNIMALRVLKNYSNDEFAAGQVRTYNDIQYLSYNDQFTALEKIADIEQELAVSEEDQQQDEEDLLQLEEEVAAGVLPEETDPDLSVAEDDIGLEEGTAETLSEENLNMSDEELLADQSDTLSENTEEFLEEPAEDFESTELPPVASELDGTDSEEFANEDFSLEAEEPLDSANLEPSSEETDTEYGDTEYDDGELEENAEGEKYEDEFEADTSESVADAEVLDDTDSSEFDPEVDHSRGEIEKMKYYVDLDESSDEALSRIVIEEVEPLDLNSSWLSAQFAYLRNLKSDDLPAYYSALGLRYGLNLFSRALFRSETVQDSLTLEGGAFLYKILNYEGVSNDAYTVAPLIATGRYNVMIGESFGIFAYFGAVKNFVLSNFQGSDDAIARLSGVLPAWGGGLLFRIGPNWNLRVDAGIDMIGGGLVLRF